MFTLFLPNIIEPLPKITPPMSSPKFSRTSSYDYSSYLFSLHDDEDIYKSNPTLRGKRQVLRLRFEFKLEYSFKS